MIYEESLHSHRYTYMVCTGIMIGISIGSWIRSKELIGRVVFIDKENIYLSNQDGLMNIPIDTKNIKKLNEEEIFREMI